MTEPILHHYPPSPVSEKVRVVLGFKGLSWRSVTIPRIPPKPKLMPLTGGFRLTPVMQIGAEIYCDSLCIIRELEARYPVPTLFPDGEQGLAWGLARWTDGEFFKTVLSAVFSDGLDHMPEGFAEDRIGLYFGGADTVEEMKARLPADLAALRAMFGWIEDALDGREFLNGASPGLADALGYYLAWFLRGRFSGGPDLLGQFPRLLAWERTIKNIGHGKPEDLDEDAALDIARAADPEPGLGVDPADPMELAQGDRIAVRPWNDPNETEGDLITLQRDRIAVLREDADVGQVAVHFPRVGYVIRKL